jgi:hypothetical protein
MIAKALRSIIKYFVIPSAIILVITGGIYQLLNPIKTIYNISATTEKAKCKIQDLGISSFNVDKAIVYNEKDEVQFKEFSGNFRFFNPATIEFQRISNGPFIVTIYSQDNKSIGALFKDEQLVYSAKNRLEFIINNTEAILSEGKSIVVPISGQVEAGEDIAGQVEYIMSPILRGGTVSMAGYSRFSSSYFSAGSEELYMGDRLIFENPSYIKSNIKDPISAIGFVQVSEEPAFKIAYRVEAEKAKVLKPGPRDVESGYVFSATIYDRLLNDKFFQSITLVFGILVTLASIGSFTLDYLNFKRKPNEN